MNESYDYLKRLLLLPLVQSQRQCLFSLPGQKRETIHVNYMLKLKPIPRHISIYKMWSFFLPGQIPEGADCTVSDIPAHEEENGSGWLFIVVWPLPLQTEFMWNFRPPAWRRVIFYPTLEVKWAQWDPKSLTNPLLCHSEDLCLMQGLILEIAWGQKIAWLI